MKYNRSVLSLNISLLFLLSHQVSFAKNYSVDESHSNIGFVARHLVSNLPGTFKKFEGGFSFDPKEPEASKLTAEAVVTSIDTNDAKRDKHLLSEDFFDAKKFQKIIFVSKKFTPNGAKKFKMDGDLTMRGVSKPVTFDVDFLGIADDTSGGHRIGFTASTKVNRKDYGIRGGKAGSIMIGDDVMININVEGLEKN